MDIYDYKDKTLDKLRNMNTEEFYGLLKKAGVKCKLVNNSKEVNNREKE